MAPPPTGRETEDWLTSHGWYPGRDIGARAEQLIALLVEDAEEQGSPLAPSRAAAEFLHTFGDLTLIYPGGSGVSMILQPTPGYDGDAEDINELAESLGEALFPVGYETSEDGTVLITPGAGSSTCTTPGATTSARTRGRPSRRDCRGRAAGRRGLLRR